MSRFRILVTDGDTRAGLAVTRSLGRAGHAVIVASASGRSLAGASRHCRHALALPDPAEEPRRFAEALAEAHRTHSIDLVLPLSEVSLGCAYAGGLTDRFEVLCPDRQRYAEFVDKQALLARAAALGLEVPRGRSFDDGRSLQAFAARPVLPDRLAFPVVLKARRSRFEVDGRWRIGPAVIADDPAALREFARQPGFAQGALLQEWIPGHGEAISVLARDGEIVDAIAHRRLRERPPAGGVSVLRESIEPDPALLAGTRALLRAVDWTGVAMVEFRRAPTGRAVLMEINPRFWGSLQLAIDAGIDFPARWVALHRGERLAPARARIGVRSRWLLGDVDHLLLSLFVARERRATGRTRRSVARDFLAAFADGTRLEVLRADDPRPFLRELLGRARKAARLVRRIARPRRSG